MKVLLVLLALLPATALADPVTYKVRATAVVKQAGTKPCGAAKRMLKDRHRITAYVDGVLSVNGMRWANLMGSEIPGEAYLAFHQGQKVWLAMWVIANDNKLIGLYALNGPDCQDVVRLEGVRL